MLLWIVMFWTQMQTWGWRSKAKITLYWAYNKGENRKLSSGGKTAIFKMLDCGEFTKAQARIHTEGERGDPEKGTTLLWEAAKNKHSAKV